MICGFRYLALESMCLLAASEFSHDAVKKHQDTVIAALKVHHRGCFSLLNFGSDLIPSVRLHFVLHRLAIVSRCF